jgi:hypothetical protein
MRPPWWTLVQYHLPGDNRITPAVPVREAVFSPPFGRNSLTEALADGTSAGQHARVQRGALARRIV